MALIQIILTEPFVRHPAGLVFELNNTTGVSGWEDEPLPEKVGFSDKRTYHLPDGGTGAAYDLPVSMTTICPPEVFETEDLHCGPCRVTGAKVLEGEEERISDLKYTIQLLELNGLNAQGLALPLAQWDNLPKALMLHDKLSGTVVRAIPKAAFETGTLDFSDLLPGFYRFLSVGHSNFS